ncbi:MULTISPECIES: hypothetical protein [Kosakonia]|uniref:hypothetical protein n=1 Tax=Kosakonia TaxID=1330547 RepID=UPI00201E095C|nr:MULTISPECIES: hypothetical protein [Kosakonia]MCL6743113.1 hypothetical protein [Kosakonia sp. R1.Fl]MDZ7324012.1 hypothetical protein [Kosakonia sacchari]
MIKPQAGDFSPAAPTLAKPSYRKEALVIACNSVQNSTKNLPLSAKKPATGVNYLERDKQAQHALANGSCTPLATS